jgi:phospholipid transport system substrate-binding protein
LLVLALVSLVNSTGARAATQAPADFITAIAAELADEVALRNPALKTDPAMQRALVEDILRPRFDLERSLALILREHWTSARADVRQAVLDAFYEFLLASYGSALHWFRPGTITVPPEQPPLVADRYRVQTVLRMHDGETYRVQFYLRQKDGAWHVIDVIVDGVSYVRTWHSDFGALVRAEGLQGLIDWLNETAANRLP